MPRPKGGYKLQDGSSVIGVTTITGRFKDSGGLLYWACEQGRAIERGEISKLYDKRDSAAEAGTLCHDMVEAHIKKEPVPDLSKYPEKIAKQAQQGYENYLEWEQNSNIKIILTEPELVSEKYKFGGCPDAIGVDSRGRLCIPDWKTSSGDAYVDYLLQLAAYKILWEENNPDKPITGGFHLCRFVKENADFHHHYWSELEDAKEMFLHLRECYELDKKLKKRL